MIEQFWVGTNGRGEIVNWSEAAPVMLNCASRALRGRSLIIMFIAGRPDPSALTRVLWGESVRGTGQIRPIERKPVTVEYHIQPVVAADDDPADLRWTFVGTDPIPHIVIWREGRRRCELWVFPAGNSVLRVFDCTRVILEESYPRGQGWRRANELRTATSDRTKSTPARRTRLTKRNVAPFRPGRKLSSKAVDRSA